MTDQSRPAASPPPVPIGPPRPRVAFGEGVAFGQLSDGPGAARPDGGGPTLEPASPAIALQAHAGSLPRSDLTDPLRLSNSSGAPSPQKESAGSSAPRAAAMHPNWPLPPIAPRAHRRGASSDNSTLGPDPSRHGAGDAAAELAAAAAGVREAAGTRASSAEDRRSGGSGGARQRAVPPPTAASLVRAEEREDRLRRGQSLLVDEAHSLGGIAQVGCQQTSWSLQTVSASSS